MFIFSDGGGRGVKKLVIFCGRHEWMTLENTRVSNNCTVTITIFVQKSPVQCLFHNAEQLFFNCEFPLYSLTWTIINFCYKPSTNICFTVCDYILFNIHVYTHIFRSGIIIKKDFILKKNFVIYCLRNTFWGWRCKEIMFVR